MHKTEEFYKQKLPLDTLLTLLKKYDDLGDSTMRTWFTTNHVENSWNGTEYDKYGDMAKALAVFSATWNGIPLLYSGQELPNWMTDRIINSYRVDYIKSIPKAHQPDTKVKAKKPWQFNITTTPNPIPQPKPKPNPKDRDILIPKTCLLKIKNPKVNSLYHELQNKRHQ